MRALIFPHLTWITSCYVASATRSRVTPLILPAPNTTTRFSSRSFNFCNFTPRIHQKWSQKVKKHTNFPEGGGESMPPDPSNRCAMHALIAYWNPPFQNSRSATGNTSFCYDTITVLLLSNFIYLYHLIFVAFSWSCFLRLLLQNNIFHLIRNLMGGVRNTQQLLDYEYY